MISNIKSRTNIMADGIQYDFYFEFDIWEPAGKEQVLFFLKEVDGTITQITDRSKLNVDLENKKVTYPYSASSSEVLTPVEKDRIVIIARYLPLQQPFDFMNNGIIPKAVEGALDYEMMIIQQVEDGIEQLLDGYDSKKAIENLTEGQRHLTEEIEKLNQSKVDKATVPNVITDINMQVEENQATLILSQKNTDTGSIESIVKTMPLANDTAAGIMPKESFTQITKNTEDIAAHDGLLTYLPGYDFGTAMPSRNDLNNYALSQGKVQPFQNSLAVRNLYNGVEWIYNAADDQWIAYGQGDVQMATNSSLGITKGNLSENGVTVGNDGGMTVPGLSSKAKKDLSDASVSPEFQALLKTFLATRDLNNLSDVGKNKFVKRTIFKPTVISWTGELPTGSSTSPGVSNITVDITLDNLPSWFDFAKDRSFIELNLSIRIYANTNPTVNQLPYGQYIAVSYSLNSSYLEEYNTNISGICKITAGMGADISNLICQVNKNDPKINLTLYNPSNNDSIRYFVDIKKVTAYQYQV